MFFVGPKILAYYVTYDRWFEVRPPKKAIRGQATRRFQAIATAKASFGGLWVDGPGVFFCADGRKGGLEDWTT